MTMMAILKPARPIRKLDHLVCADLAVDAEAAQMIHYAHAHNRPVLVGLEGGEAIVKPSETGDERLSFEGLYDTAVSIREFRKMAELKVRSPEEFPPSLYEAEVLLTEIGFVPTVRVRFSAKGDVGARTALTELVNHPEFREQMVRRFVMQLIESDDAKLVTRGCLKVDEVAPPDLRWEFLEND